MSSCSLMLNTLYCEPIKAISTCFTRKFPVFRSSSSFGMGIFCNFFKYFPIGDILGGVMEIKKSFLAMGLLVAAASLVSCGDEVTEVTENYTTGLKVLESKQKMPACDKGALGDILYVTDSSAVFYCNGKKWVNMKSRDGKDGVDGQNGIDGEKGAKGERGDDGTSCTAKTVSNKSKTRKGIEVRCDEKVVDTLWSADGPDLDLGCNTKVVVNKDSTDYGIEMECDGYVIDTLWGYIPIPSGSEAKSSSSKSNKSSSSKKK